MTRGKRLGVENVGGLSLSLLQDQRGSNIVSVPSVPHLGVLTAGPKPPNPTELLGSVRMNELIKTLLAGTDTITPVDTIVIDTPPALGFADAAVLAARAHGVIIVTRSGVSRERALVRAYEALQRVQARIVGVVVNGMKENRKDDYSYYRYYEKQASGEIPAITVSRMEQNRRPTADTVETRW